MSGPSRAEVLYRETFDRESGELIGTTRDYANCRDRCALLPEPTPRALRTVFYFASTTAAVPQDAQPSLVPEAASSTIPQITSEPRTGGDGAHQAAFEPQPVSDVTSASSLHTLPSGPPARQKQQARRPWSRGRADYETAFARLPRGS